MRRNRSFYAGDVDGGPHFGEFAVVGTDGLKSARCSSRVRASAPSWVMPRHARARCVELERLSIREASTELPDAAVIARWNSTSAWTSSATGDSVVTASRILLQFDQLAGGDFFCRPGGGCQLEDPAHVEEFEDGRVMLELDDETERVDERFGRQVGDVRAITLADIQDADE